MSVLLMTFVHDDPCQTCSSPNASDVIVDLGISKSWTSLGKGELSLSCGRFSTYNLHCVWLISQNCMKIQSLLKSGAFGPLEPSFINDFEEKCNELFPLSTAFRTSSPSEVTPSISQVKEVAAKNISATGGAVVLKETSLSSAAMSDLSGDINDLAVISQNSVDDSKSEDAASRAL